jgi:hypothetical protein
VVPLLMSSCGTDSTMGSDANGRTPSEEGASVQDVDAALNWARSTVDDVAAALGTPSAETTETDLSARDELGAADPSRLIRTVSALVSAEEPLDLTGVDAVARDAGLERTSSGESNAFYRSGDRRLSVTVQGTNPDGSLEVLIRSETEPFPEALVEGR